MVYNKVILAGNLVADPELKTSSGGKAYCKISLAVNEKRAGEEKVSYFNVSCFNQTAENLCKYMKKGSNIFVEGTLSFESYQDKDGNKKQSIQVIANTIQFVGQGSLGKSKRDEKSQEEETPIEEEFKDDFVPF